MRKKLWIAVILLAAGLVSQWLTVNAFSDNFREKAEKYIAEMAEVDPFWKWENPKIVWQTPFYDSDDNKPSYIEYKVSCNRDTNCWYVLVNLDGSDVDIPESSSVWKAPSEQMDKTGNWKNYNFWVFEKFSYDENTWDIWYINPGNEALEEQAKQSVFSKNTMSSVKTDPLKEKFEKLKKEAKENKEENVQKQLLNKREEFSKLLISPMVYYKWDYGLVTKNIINENWCTSILPCYDQFVRNYWDLRGMSWCTPTAVAMILWYYDRNWFNNIFENVVAPATNDSFINRILIELWNSMWTFWSRDDGDTSQIWNWSTFSEETLKWFNYLDNRNIPKTTSRLDYSMWNLKWEINSSRPLLLDYEGNDWSWHIIAVFWFKSYNIIIANFGWWTNHWVNTHINIKWKTFTTNNWIASWTIKWLYTLRLN